MRYHYRLTNKLTRVNLIKETYVMIKYKSDWTKVFLIFSIAFFLSCEEEENSDFIDFKPCAERAVFGSPLESEYVLPFPPGKSYELVQSYCTPNNSHRNQLAYDFLMPIGAFLTATRSGIVVELVENQPDAEPGGVPIGIHNHINIEHPDGSVSFYAHFKQDEIWVNVGDVVNTGDTIGLSGNSGSSIPHLHFGVYRTWPAYEGDDLAVNFKNTIDSLDENGGLIAGLYYTALPY